MHSVDSKIDGKISGWISEEDSGAPGTIRIMDGAIDVSVLANLTRYDVMEAGYNLYSGFDFEIINLREKKRIEVVIESDIYDIHPRWMKKKDIIQTKEEHTDKIILNLEIKDIRFVEIGSDKHQSYADFDLNDNNIELTMDGTTAADLSWINLGDKIVILL